MHSRVNVIASYNLAFEEIQREICFLKETHCITLEERTIVHVFNASRS